MKTTSQKLYWLLKKAPYKLNDSQIFEFLGFLLTKNREQITLDETEKILEDDNLKVMLDQIASGYPLAYLTHTKKFNEDVFYINEDVLIPRDETNLLVEQAQGWLKKQQCSRILNILDLCSGSGICGLTLKKHFPETNVYLSDISEKAMHVAQINAAKLNLNVNCLLGDFEAPTVEKQLKYDLIICNPPYISEQDLSRDCNTNYEPKLALIAANNGYVFYERFFKNIGNFVRDLENFCIILEHGWNQKEKITELIVQCPNLTRCRTTFFKDWANHWRGVVITNE